MELNKFYLIFNTLVLNYVILSIGTTEAYTSPEIALDSEGKYLLSWEVNDEKKTVTFFAKVQTTGYVGLGISPNGGMEGADIFIGGVDSNTGQQYFSDRHGIGEVVPKEDTHPDWDLINAVENNGWTNLTFSRLWDTCDNEDFAITYEATTRLIYSYGEDDTLRHHGPNRGAVPASLLDNDQENVDPSIKSWKVTVDMTIPSYETSYWCTIHKRDPFGGLKHVVGFDAFLGNNSTAKKHTHHLVLHRCHPPPGATAEETFQNFVNHPGEECYIFATGELPKQYCTEYMFIWATGGKTTWFPDDVGYPIEETAEESPYFMLEIHFDNPQEAAGVSFETGVTVYYTDVFRTKIAGLMTMGYDFDPSLTVPPDAEDFVLAGHCSDHCTKTFPTGGINIYNVLLHSHLSGRKMQIRHFRGKEELPWVYSDPSYDFNFQQNKALKTHVNVLPGDHLITECIYNSKWNNGTVIMGGFQTNEEMCSSHIWYYPRMTNIDYCASSYDLDQNFKDFGITEYVMPDEINGIPIILAPLEMKDLNYTAALSTKFNWTEEFRRDFQEKRRFGYQDQVCAVLSAGPPDSKGQRSKYPDDFKEYVPKDTCSSGVKNWNISFTLGMYLSLFCITILY